MPYYRHGSLAQYLKQPLTDQQKHLLMVATARLVSTFHESGWLHNDIKPSNILLDSLLLNSADNSSIMPSLVLTDFALATSINKPMAVNFAGTPAYLAPECWQGQGATLQSDIYAFGIVLYEILVGKRPFATDPSSSELLKDWAIQHCQQPIPILPSQYGRYQFIIEKALAKQMEKRYYNMKEVLIDLTLLQNK